MTNKLLRLALMIIFVSNESYTINYKSNAMNKVIGSFSFFVLLFSGSNLVFGQQLGPANDDSALETAFWMAHQNQGETLDSLRIWQEQVLLHTDKEVATPKDYLFFKAYVLTGPKQLRASVSNVLKVELLDSDGALMGSQYHKIVDGSTFGSFKVPKKSKSGKYYLRAYTRWMLNYGPENFATKEIAVLNRSAITKAPTIGGFDVRIFPEGGNLIAGLDNRVALSLNGYDGGFIVVEDANGVKVADVQNFGNGLGTFLLKPESEKKYALRLQDGKRIALPNIGKTGYSLQINTIDNAKVVAKIATTQDLRNQDIYLKGKVNGTIFFESKVKFKETNSVEVDIPKADLPNGILELQLLDEFDQVWATRPLHVDHRELVFQIEKSGSDEGESIKIKVTDGQGFPVKTSISVALTKHMTRQDAHLESPRNQRFVNDLLVLTQQSPKDYRLNTTQALPNEIKYTFQQGLEFYGRAYDLDAVPLPNTKIQIVISGQGEAVAHEVETNEEGLFKLSNLQIQGEADMVFRRIAEGQRDKYVKVVPYQYETPPLQLKDTDGDRDGKLRSQQFIPKKQVATFKGDEKEERLINLEGVTLVGEKLQVKRTPPLYNIEPTRVVYQNPERPRTIPQLFLNIPGVQVVNLGNLNPSLSIPKTQGTGPVLWVVDGIPLSQAPVEDGTTPLADIMSIIPFVDVDRIEILFGAQAAIFGSRAAGGAILIYTRNGDDEEYLNRKKAQLTFEGYHNSLPFYVYQAQKNGEKRKKARETLYWNPDLMTNADGEAEIRLPKLKGGMLHVDLRAITPEGKSGRFKSTL